MNIFLWVEFMKTERSCLRDYRTYAKKKKKDLDKACEESVLLQEAGGGR